MGAWDFNLQIPYQAPAYTAQGLTALGQGLAAGVSGYLADRNQKQKEAEQLQYENVKNQTIVKNLFDSKLVSPEQYLEFQSAPPKKQKALAEGYAATVSFNLMQAAKTPRMITLPGSGGVGPQTLLAGAGFNDNLTPKPLPTVATLPQAQGTNAPQQTAIVDSSGKVVQNITPWRPEQVNLPGTPGTPPVGAGQGMYAEPGQQPGPEIAGVMRSPNQWEPMKPAEPPLGITTVKAADGTTINVLSGGPMKGAQVLKPTDTFSGLKTMISQMTPEQIQANAQRAHKIVVPQSDGSMLYLDDPSYIAKGEKDSLAQFTKDLAATQEMLDNNVTGGGKGEDAASPVSAFSEAQLKAIQDTFTSRLKNLTTPKQSAAGPDGGRMLSPQDQSFLDWALRNPNDPRAAQIKQRLGIQP